MSRRSIIVAAAAVTLLAGACTNGSTPSGGSSSSGSGNVKEGGTLRLAAFDGIDSLNPRLRVAHLSVKSFRLRALAEPIRNPA
jgi:hypothetical protein